MIKGTCWDVGETLWQIVAQRFQEVTDAHRTHARESLAVLTRRRSWERSAAVELLITLMVCR
jgi:hypothetical protein